MAQPRLRERFRVGFEGAHVEHMTASLLRFELDERLKNKTGGWPKIIARNEWFQEEVTIRLVQVLLADNDGQNPVVFSYSYAARRILAEASERGCTTLLGQIDPGLEEENLVAEAVAECQEFKPNFERAGSEYWDNWREECRLADRILINSEWSRDALIRTGIDSEKLRIAPLMYRLPGGVEFSAQTYPHKFDRERPLRVLFLGSLIVRKGVHLALQAARLLVGEPVEFWFVGGEGVKLPSDLAENPAVRWIGPVSRAKTSEYYRHCDLFLFPTLSDGFGLTQLEAMAHGLPVIASENCARVVRDGREGRVLEENTELEIAGVLAEVLAKPEQLSRWSMHTLERVRDFSPENVMPLWLAAAND